MKKHAAIAVALSATLGVSAVVPAFPLSQPVQVEAASFDYTQDQQEAMQYLNQVRAKLGLQPVQLDPLLNKAIDNHVKYLNINGFEELHKETQGKKGFTGIKLGERVTAVGGDPKNTSEVLNWGGGAANKTIESLLDAPLHRVALINPNIRQMGSAHQGFIFGMLVKSPDKMPIYNQDIAYPYDGQTNVEIGFYGNEAPNPLEEYDLDKSGYIISFSPPIDIFVEDIDFTLKDSKGAIVPVIKEINYVGDSFFIPKLELKYSEKYTASAYYKDAFDGRTGGKTWSFTTKADPYATPTPVSKFTDYQSGEYWSENMLWAIDQGLISGYTNVKNKTTGKYENLLRPQDKLTEAQFLAVMFRYTNKDELAKTKPADPNYWASTAYQLAEKYKLPTNATLTNRKSASVAITRGKMAQILASKHFNKYVSERSAVQFMYDAGLSSGYLDKDGRTPKTYESYGANEILLRAHIVTFMKNYDTYLKRTK